MDCPPPGCGQVLVFYGLNIYIYIYTHRERERERELSWRGWGRKDSDGRRNRGKNAFSNTSCHLILLKGQRLEIKTKFEINEAHSGGDIRF